MAKRNDVLMALDCIENPDNGPETCFLCPYFDKSKGIGKAHCDIKTLARDAAEFIRPKKKESRKKLQCLCGRKRIDEYCSFRNNHMTFSFECPICGLGTGFFNTEIEAIREWNRLVNDS